MNLLNQLSDDDLLKLDMKVQESLLQRASLFRQEAAALKECPYCGEPHCFTPEECEAAEDDKREFIPPAQIPKEDPR